MDTTKQKYVHVHYGIIIFPEAIEHSTFRSLKPTSAGFCYVDECSVKCFGESHSLDLKSVPDDSQKATIQLFGFEALLKKK